MYANYRKPNTVLSRPLGHGMKEFTKYLMCLGFYKNDVDLNLYFKVVNGEYLMLVLYVDDLFLIGEEP